MKTAITHLVSTAPYSQSRYYHGDPPQGEKESHADYEARTWRQRCHVNEAGNVIIPPMAFKNCLSEAAKYLSIPIKGQGKATYTKHFEAGVMVTEPVVLPIKRDEVKEEWLYVPSDGRRGGPKRVEKCFPLIHSWTGKVSFMILDDKITEAVFERVLAEAGSFIGIGRFRPRNNGFYGRFAVQNIDWSS